MRRWADLLPKAQGLKKGLDRLSQQFGSQPLDVSETLITAIRIAPISRAGMLLTDTFQTQFVAFRGLREPITGEDNPNAIWNSYTYCYVSSFQNSWVQRPYCSYDTKGRLTRCFYVYYWYWYSVNDTDYYGYTQAYEYYDPITGNITSNSVCNSGKWSPNGNYPVGRENGQLILKRMKGNCAGDKNVGSQALCVSDPINPFTGNNIQKVTDITYSPKISRFYNNRTSAFGIFGDNWSSIFDVSIKKVTHASSSTESTRVAKREDGKEITFTSADGGATWASSADVDDILTKLTDGSGNTVGWTYEPGSSLSKETYDASGNLLLIEDRNGNDVLTLDYNLAAGSGGDGKSNTLDRITDFNGNALSVSYYTFNKVDLLHTITDMEGNVYTYDHTLLSAGSGVPKKRLLTKITYPDGTFKTYTYDDTGYPYNLLSITDQNGVISNTWTYDSNNQAVASAHANGLDGYTIDYTYLEDPSDPRVIVTNPLTKQTIYHYTTINGRRLVTAIDGVASANCPASNRSYTYDSNGNYDVITDWEGNVTDYDFDLNSNLEIQRIESVGTPEQRKIVTQWDPNYRLPVQVEIYDGNNINLKRTTYSYDSNGNLTDRTETDLIH